MENHGVDCYLDICFISYYSCKINFIAETTTATRSA